MHFAGDGKALCNCARGDNALARQKNLNMDIIKSFLIILLFSLISCNDSIESGIEIDYSFDNSWEVSFSLKIDSIGNAILFERRRTDSFYISKIKNEELNILRDYLSVIALRVDSSCVYEDEPLDMAWYKINFLIDNKHYNCFVYGNTAPDVFYRLFNKLDRLRDSSDWKPTDTLYVFKSDLGWD